MLHPDHFSAIMTEALQEYSQRLAEAKLHPVQEQLRELTQSLSEVEERLLYALPRTLSFKLSYGGKEHTFTVPDQEAEEWASAVVPARIAAKDLLGYYELVEDSLQNRVCLVEIDYDSNSDRSQRCESPPIFIIDTASKLDILLLDFRTKEEFSFLWSREDNTLEDVTLRFRNYHGRLFYVHNANYLPLEEAVVPMIRKAYQKYIETNPRIH